MRPRPRIASVPPLALAGGALTVGVGGVYLAGLLLTGGDIEAGTTVRGVDIGGLSRTEAVHKLDARLTAAAPRELSVTVGDRSGTVDARQAGISYDAERTVDRASRTASDPVSVIGGLFSSGGGGAVEPVVDVDEDKARTTLGKLAKTLDQKVRDGAVSFSGGKVQQVTPQRGAALDVNAAVDTLRSAFLRDTANAVTALPVHETEPKVNAQEVNRAVRDIAEPAVSAPVTLTTEGRRVTIAPADLAAHLTLRPDASGSLTPHLDAKGLYAAPAVQRALAGVTTTPANATFALNGDRAVVTDNGRTGIRITDKALGKAVLPLLTKTGTAARTGEVAAIRTEPKLTGANAARLGVKEKLSSFTVNFEPAPYRTKNIGRAVELINGSVVAPGETWSFNRTVGQRTESNGFVEGIMILDDQFTKAPGGGVSAVATTVYNAMFFAGVKPVEHGAHSFYIERYPEGREATVAWGSLDLRFTNDLGHTLYIQAESTDHSVTINFLGTKKYDAITSVTGPRTNIHQPAHMVNNDPRCVPQTPLEGFDVEVDRVFHQNGKEVKREPFHTHYTPRDEIICTNAE
ncbi:VanW family protein [Streptomyces antibioticus]|uniref:VanW family protein n=1 Tax=Streptomyces antibioticus TaxID=1890 RepID=UPI002254D9F7|nr:VanW family protein [Streptomyces antibioticus]MCX4739357.1 VanW family protein [Streptomyces antibioticus]